MEIKAFWHGFSHAFGGDIFGSIQVRRADDVFRDFSKASGEATKAFYHEPCNGKRQLCKSSRGNKQRSASPCHTKKSKQAKKKLAVILCLGLLSI